MVTKELILDNLDCANCSMKIERDVNQIEDVSASMNFMTKTMTLQLKSDEDYKEVLFKVESIVKKYEPEVDVIEKHPKQMQSIQMDGLSCANCALKIENEIKKLEGLDQVSVDFVSQKINFALSDTFDRANIFGSIDTIVKRIEPDAKLIDESKQDKAQTSITKQSALWQDKAHRNEVLRLLFSGTLLAIGMLMNFEASVELMIFLISYLIIGRNVVWRALKGILSGQVFSEHFLMSIATIGAFLIGEYPEAVAVMLFYSVGELFQSMAVNHSRKSISALMEIRPDFANLKTGDSLVKVSPEQVRIGALIVVKPGEKIPLDGVVVDGSSMVDTAAITGESVPRLLNKGDLAYSGFINTNGVLTLQVTKTFGDSTVSKILELVQNASSKKAPTENFITKFAAVYTPAVVFAALALALIPPLLMQGQEFSVWIYRALVFLVISCPCALVISIPLGFFGGIGGASKRGILVKGGNYLEALNNVETVVFDKTGTLTKGVFKVTAISAQNGFSETDVLNYAALAEHYSNHPIALSIQKENTIVVDPSRLSGYEEIAGQGIKVIHDNKQILAGNTKLMSQEGIKSQAVSTLGSIVHVAVDKTYAGYIVISDELKPDAIQAIRQLKELGIKKIVLLTGDIKEVGERIGKQLGIDTVYSELLPHEKVERLEEIEANKSKKGKILFVGDGINDAPVLARADIGIAMGGLGSDAAIEAADIVLMSDEPSKIVTAIKIAKRTRMIVYQNIVFALGVKGVFLILGAMGVSTMWEAVFADTGVALLAVLNAMRVIRVQNI